MSRTRRFLRGLGAGYLTQVLITAGGLWLVRFLLQRLGSEDYGLWLAATQVLGSLALLDVGIVALLPREVAYATGRAGRPGPGPRDVLVGTFRLALRQSLVVAAVAAVVWWLLPASWDAVRGPIGAAFAVFAVLFPFRVFSHALRGLQDLAFLGLLEAGGWVVQAGILVALVRGGWGLWALALGWTALQVTVTVGAAWRLALVLPRPFRGTDPAAGDPAWRKDRFQRGFWVSISQVAHLLTSGIDLILVGLVLGPTAVVTYTVTAKLALVLANQPQLLLQVAEPGLSQLRTGGTPADADRATRALAEVVLLISGALACVVIAVNRSFVTWWVGADHWGGLGLTTAVIVRVLVGHWALTVATALFAAGHERHLAWTSLANGIVSVIATVILLGLLGPVGAPLGGLVAILGVSLPANLVVLGRHAGVSVVRQVTRVGPVAWRFAVGAAVAVAIHRLHPPPTFWWLALASLAAPVAFALLAVERLRHSPATIYLHPRLRGWLGRLGGAKPS